MVVGVVRQKPSLGEPCRVWAVYQGVMEASLVGLTYHYPRSGLTPLLKKP